jgi:hypothetical protein
MSRQARVAADALTLALLSMAARGERTQSSGGTEYCDRSGEGERP